MIFLIAASAFSIRALATKKKNPPSPLQVEKMVLYYGSSCPHCKIVEEYLQKNNSSDQFGIVQKEVWSGQTNQDEFVQKARACGLDLDNLGVPMLWDAATSKCYMGDQPIIEFLKDRSGQSQQYEK